VTRAVAAEPDGEALPRHDVAVFINCPFDGAYGEFLDAIIFTVVCCGFEPRSALDTDNTSDSRMKRIVDALRGSHLSIHDLSRVYGDAGTGVAHFNMPLELGIAMAMKQSHDNKESKLPHNWTALVMDGSAYRNAVSDLNGHDLKRYSTRDTLVAQVMAWLTTRMKGRRVAFKPTDVLAALKDYDTQLGKLREDWVGVAPPWSDIVAIGKQVAAARQLQVLALAPPP
jgi:hypothetical protein